MKILGQHLSKDFVHPFLLQRPDGNAITFHLCPLPLSFQQKIRKRGIVPPLPPVIIARDSNGKPLKDASGMAVTQKDLANHDYRQALETYHQRVAVLAIVESLRRDGQVQFETQPPDETDKNAECWANFADAIFGELEQAGLSPGDLISFCDEICRISNMLDSQIKESQANFS